MIRWYILPTSRCSAKRQLETIEPFRQKRDALYQEAAPAKRKGLPERDGQGGLVASFRPKYKELVGVAHFYNLALDPEDLNNVTAALEAKGAVIFEAASQRHSDDQKALRAMFAEATQVYDGKTLTKVEARALGKRRAETWDAAQPKPGRMPFAEAQVYFNDLSKNVDEVVAEINRFSAERIGKDRKKRYPTKWTRDFAYYWRRKGKITFPQRAAGRPRKQNREG